jgi:hypothetical protein
MFIGDLTHFGIKLCLLFGCENLEQILDRAYRRNIHDESHRPEPLVGYERKNRQIL